MWKSNTILLSPLLEGEVNSHRTNYPRVLKTDYTLTGTHVHTYIPTHTHTHTHTLTHTLSLSLLGTGRVFSKDTAQWLLHSMFLVLKPKRSKVGEGTASETWVCHTVGHCNYTHLSYPLSARIKINLEIPGSIISCKMFRKKKSVTPK